MPQKVNVENTSRQDDYPRPDFNQLIPFRPSSKPGLLHSIVSLLSKYQLIYNSCILNLVLGVHVVPGGDFPVPPAVAYLMTQIPPPSCFVVLVFVYYSSNT